MQENVALVLFYPYFTPSKPARPKCLETGEIAFTNEFAAEEDMETGQIIVAMSASARRVVGERTVP
jgi:hypothetical protein